MGDVREASGQAGVEIVWANSNLVGFQGRMYAPGYSAPARWILLNPLTRRAFSALGKDVVPEVLEVLEACANGATRSEISQACSGVDEDRLEGLLGSGILTSSPVVPIDGFTSIYHAANVDFPFFDYGSPGVVGQESDLLDHYAGLWPSPPAIAVRDGESFDLPNVPLGFPDEGKFPSISGLAQVLRTVLSPIGEIHTRHAECIRRTVPSGGARHPTELVWISRDAMDSIPPGAYSYDASSHSLVREALPAESAYLEALREDRFGFVIRSRVARAMWRYRDLRALRPLIIDAGHVAEMLMCLLARAGIVTDLLTMPVLPERPDWLEEPELALVRPQLGTMPNLSPVHGEVDSVSPAGPLATNPALVLRFDGGLGVEVIHPKRRRLGIDQTDFLILNHCLPSTRGDRDTSVPGIIGTVPAATAERVAFLQEAGALLTETEAKLLYAPLKLWVRHDWYLAALSLLDASTRSRQKPAVSLIESRCDYFSDPQVLTRRKTARRFTSDPVQREILDHIVSSAVGGGYGDLTVTAHVRLVPGMDPGLHRLSESGWEFLGTDPGAEGVAAATSGQTAAAGGAFTVWLSLHTEPDDPAGYLRDLLDLGRLGQRICASATEYGLSVFLTPAAGDTRTCELLGLSDVQGLLTYVFAVGVPYE